MNWMFILDASEKSGDGFNPISIAIFVVAMGALVYFMMYRPQKKQREQHQRMMSSMRKGDKVVTIGGIHGTVVSVKEKYIVLKIADNADVNIRVNPSAIGGVVSQGDESDEE